MTQEETTNLTQQPTNTPRLEPQVSTFTPPVTDTTPLKNSTTKEAQPQDPSQLSEQMQDLTFDHLGDPRMDALVTHMGAQFNSHEPHPPQPFPVTPFLGSELPRNPKLDTLAGQNGPQVNADITHSGAQPKPYLACTGSQFNLNMMQSPEQLNPYSTHPPVQLNPYATAPSQSLSGPIQPHPSQKKKSRQEEISDFQDNMAKGDYWPYGRDDTRKGKGGRGGYN